MGAGNRKQQHRRVHERIRKKVRGTAERPRLAVTFSNQHVYAQMIDDEAERTLVSASTVEKGLGLSGANIPVAAKIGELIANRAKEKNISEIVFDRGGFRYHGKVKALADAARTAGLKF